MAINDRFNRPGDSWPARLDHYITGQADRFGEWWAAHTRWDCRVLTQSLLTLSAFAALERVIVFRDILYLFIAFAVLQTFVRANSGAFGPRFGGLVEQIQYEAAGLPGWTAGAINVLCLFTGLLALANATGFLLASAVDGVAPPLALLDSLLAGIAFTGWKGAEYILRTNPSGPSGTPRRSEA